LGFTRIAWWAKSAINIFLTLSTAMEHGYPSELKTFEISPSLYFKMKELGEE